MRYIINCAVLSDEQIKALDARYCPSGTKFFDTYSRRTVWFTDLENPGDFSWSDHTFAALEVARNEATYVVPEFSTVTTCTGFGPPRHVTVNGHRYVLEVKD